jgi:hypothetical protein
MTGHLSSRHPVVVGAGDVSWGYLQLVWRRRGRDPGDTLQTVCGFFSSVSHLQKCAL